MSNTIANTIATVTTIQELNELKAASTKRQARVIRQEFGRFNEIGHWEFMASRATGVELKELINAIDSAKTDDDRIVIYLLLQYMEQQAQKDLEYWQNKQ